MSESQWMTPKEIEKSLAGFSPKSLQGAVRHGGAAHASPVPSPNPVPRPPQGNLPCGDRRHRNRRLRSAWRILHSGAAH